MSRAIRIVRPRREPREDTYGFGPRMGETHYLATATNDQVDAMRDLYYTSGWLIDEIAQLFGMRYPTVWAIVHFKSWAWRSWPRVGSNPDAETPTSIIPFRGVNGAQRDER